MYLFVVKLFDFRLSDGCTLNKIVYLGKYYDIIFRQYFATSDVCYQIVSNSTTILAGEHLT